ncbi:MAG TPA: phosphoribosyltransferase [Persephonella sp.]|uniref:Phosphoribosyltransferase n=1 Tax=Persephonella marina (strain DSM 14350 / EX-H1) TaxID=123214 RepID=C0QSF0_PERMH|nr:MULTISPECIES: phosphoribosyltransferase family protein [Persephonella]ACO03287.1 phosphoribosyltransferase [Persephonella marina EX-H1]HCB69344.1 phosphoribosyltransferase [Persephonella sp.]
MKFRNREEAGKLLAGEIKRNLEKTEDVVILAIPRGGVPVAYYVSKETGIPFHMVVTKKITPPYEPEAAIGAIAPDGTFMISSYAYLSEKELEEAKKRALEGALEKLKKYSRGEEPYVKDKTVIVVDDGIATGYTAMVAGEYLKKRGAKKVILAVPVCPVDSVERVKKVFDQVICYHKDNTPFFAVGMFYEDFHQVTDDEMFNYIKKAEKEGLLYKKEGRE